MYLTYKKAYIFSIRTTKVYISKEYLNSPKRVIRHKYSLGRHSEPLCLLQPISYETRDQNNPAIDIL